ncbi:MAG: class I SAM-dependent methyltransferase [Desulfobacterales bacterium]|nr:class I SAM-dependent methyltransferase [Desulfobacterales bacterium]
MNDKLNQKNFWDRVAGDKKFTTPFQMSLFAEYVSKNSYILDVGCGYGRTLNELYFSGYKKLIGVDFSEKMVESGKDKHPFLDLRVNNSSELPFYDDSFDAVIIIAVLTCIAEDDNQKRLVKEINRVLKPGGIFYLNDFIINDDVRNIERYKKYEGKYKKYGVFELPEGAVLRHHTKEWIIKLTSVFKKILLRSTKYKTMNGHKSNGLYYMGRSIKN